MEERITVRQWRENYINGMYNEKDTTTMCDAGWYDWFCKDSSLVGRLKKFGSIIKKIDNDKEIYLRVLGFNDIGRNYLKQIKKDIDVINTCKQGINKALDIEINATYIYSLVTGDNSLIEREYKNKPIIFH